MSKPNPEAFAEYVLWSLAGIQAQLTEIEAQLVSTATGADPAAIARLTAESAARRLQKQKDLFADMQRHSGVGGSPSSEPPAPHR